MMKKFMILSALALVLGAGPAVADSHEGGEKAGKFQKHDVNGDGVISKDEFLQHAEERFSTIDADGDGNVSKEEAKAGHEKRRKAFQERRDNRQDQRQERLEGRASE